MIVIVKFNVHKSGLVTDIHTDQAPESTEPSMLLRYTGRYRSDIDTYARFHEHAGSFRKQEYTTEKERSDTALYHAIHTADMSTQMGRSIRHHWQNAIKWLQVRDRDFRQAVQFLGVGWWRELHGGYSRNLYEYAALLRHLEQVVNEEFHH